jgi:hypothetical protein
MNETIIVASVLSVLLVISLVLAVSNIRLRRTLKIAEALFIQSELDKTMINKHLGEVVLELEQREVQNTDGFVKFLSDSREYAFKYIEDTQNKFKEFQKVVEPLFEEGKTLGESKIVEGIYQEYLKLKTIIPDEQGETNAKSN